MPELTQSTIDEINAIVAQLQDDKSLLRRVITGTGNVSVPDEAGDTQSVKSWAQVQADLTAAAPGIDTITGRVDPNDSTQYEITFVLTDGANEVVSFALDSGSDGANAWTPVFSLRSVSGEVYFHIDSWSGGTGTAPATGYIQADGTVSADVGTSPGLRGPSGSGDGGSGGLAEWDSDDGEGTLTGEILIFESE